MDAASMQLFCEAWNLNDDAITKLYSLAPEVQEIVINDFKPKSTPGTEVNGMFIAFAASVDKRMKSAAIMARLRKARAVPLGRPMLEKKNEGGWGTMMHKSGGKGQEDAMQRYGEDPVAGFIKYWGLNGDSQKKLEQLSLEQLDIVLNQFNPPLQAKESVGGVDGKLIMFAASVQNSKGGKGRKSMNGAIERAPSDPIDAFCAHWNLNTDARAKLQQLSWDQLGIVMSEFAPPSVDVDNSGKLIMFAASIQKRTHASPTHSAWFGWSGPSLPQGYGAWPAPISMKRSAPTDPGYVQEAPMKRLAGKGMKGSSDSSMQHWGTACGGKCPKGGAKGASGAVAAFIAHFNLNEDAQTKLWQLSQEELQIVMNEFNPPPQAMESPGGVNGKLIMFANSVRTRLQGGHGKGGAGKYGASVPQTHDPVEAFVQHWNLNADAKAKLQQLSWEELEIVMSEFQPPPNSPENNGKLIMFASSVQKRLGGGKGGARLS